MTNNNIDQDEMKIVLECDTCHIWKSEHVVDWIDGKMKCHSCQGIDEDDIIDIDNIKGGWDLLPKYMQAKLLLKKKEN